jgi:predicted nucleic acid-binding protein
VTRTVFADSSALVKLYADEQAADIIRSIPHLLVSQLARVEVPAALWRKHRVGELSVPSTAALVAAFEVDYFGVDGTPARFSIIGLTASILDDAARLVGTHGLRGYDAVQLACACAARGAIPEGVTFTAFDKTLCAAAAAEGLDLLTEADSGRDDP